MAEEDVEKAAFTYHKGRFKFLKMTFGVKNAPAIFQTLIEKVVKGLGHCVRAYMDDLVVFSGSWKEYKAHVRQVLGTLRKAGLTTNPSKHQWGGEGGKGHGDMSSLSTPTLSGTDDKL